MPRRLRVHRRKSKLDLGHASFEICVLSATVHPLQMVTVSWWTPTMVGVLMVLLYAREWWFVRLAQVCRDP